jgi:non-heme chloroperoxidase
MRFGRVCACAAIVLTPVSSLAAQAAAAPPAASPAAPAPAASTALRSALLKTESGLTLHYVVQGDPKGPVVVLAHGIGDSWHSWELVLPRIPKTFRTYAITLRGHGLSDHPPSGYSRADFGADISGFLSGLGLEKVCLVGHSLGSFAAQEAATGKEARRISRLVLVGSSPSTPRDPAVVSEVSTLFASIKDPIDPLLARDFQISTTVRPLPAAFLETMIGEMQKAPARVWNEVAASFTTPRLPAHLEEIKVPTLLMWGDKDAMMTRADQDALLAAIKGSRLVVYPGTGHAPHWEEPERFARDLVAFLQR